MNRPGLQQSIIIFALVALSLSACGAHAPDPEAAQKYHGEGMWYLTTVMTERDPEKAVEWFTKAIHADPGFVKSYNARGVAYVLLGEYEKASADFEDALLLDPSYDPALENLLHLNRGEYDQVLAVEF